MPAQAGPMQGGRGMPVGWSEADPSRTTPPYQDPDPITAPLPVVEPAPFTGRLPTSPSHVPADAPADRDRQPSFADIVRNGPPIGAGAASGRWSIVDVLAGLGLVLLLSVLLGWPFLAAPHLPAELRLIVGGFLPIWLGLAGTAVIASRVRGTGRLGRDLGLRFRPVDLAIGLGAGVGLRIASGIITIAVTRLSGRELTSNGTTINTGVTGAWVMLNLVVAATLISPFVEEIFFRGLTIRGTLGTLARRRAPAGPGDAGRQRRATVVISSVLFTVMHLQEVTDPYSAMALVVTLLLTGGTLGLLTFATGRLGPAIATHVVFNGIAAALTFVAS